MSVPDPIIEDALLKKYPRLFKNCKYLAVGVGWMPIIDALSEKLEAIYQALPEEEKTDVDCYVAGQVKEKFGGLRFYMDGETKEMSAAIDEAEAAADETCEFCGAKGKKDHISSWIKTLCMKCTRERIKANSESSARYQTLRVVDAMLPHIPKEDWAIILTKLEGRYLKAGLVQELKKRFDPLLETKKK
jgi:hypothetical protein